MREKKVSYKGEKRSFWVLTISGQDSLHCFRDKIGFDTKRKNSALDKICNVPGNTNVDVIPTVGPLLEDINTVFGSQLHNLSAFHELRIGKRDPSPARLSQVIADIRTRVARFKNISSSMHALEALPELEELIRLGESNKDLNRKLWQEMSSTWAWIKDRKGEPGLANVLTLARIVRGENYEEAIAGATQRIHSGFLDFDAGITERKSLGKALRKNIPDRTSYTMLREASKFISETYKRIAENLPHVEGILGMLERLATADLAWDPIVKIEKIENIKDKYVYDLEVKNEIFMAGMGGMFVHNSYLTKLEILRTLMFDTEVIVIDPEREYEFLAEAVGGRYFNISLTSEHHINPFDLPPIGEDESPGDVLRSHIITLVGLFRIMLGGLTPEEDSIIDNAITETYALKDITQDKNFNNLEPPLLSDLELVLAGMEGGASLAQRLLKYTQGTWAGFINRPTNVDINKKFVVFSVRDMEDELKPVAMHIVMNYIWNSVRKELKKRLLVIDEAWWMMKSPDTASFLYGLAKRCRKYYLGLATITQDVEDFLKSQYGLPIITNSSIQLLMKQSPASIDLVQKTFNLTEEEKFLLLESAVGEGIFFAGMKHVAIKVISSYTENQIITSDPSQLLAIKKAKAELRAAQASSKTE